MEIKRWLGILLVGGVLACICYYCLLQTGMEMEETEQISESAWEEVSQKEEVQQSGTPENSQDTGKLKIPEVTVTMEESTQSGRVEEPERTTEPYETEVPQKAEESGESELPTLPVKQETEIEPKESTQPKEEQVSEPSANPVQSEEPIQPVQPIQTSPPTPTPVWEPTPSPEQITNTPSPPQKEEEHIHDFKKSIWELPTCQKGGYFNNICQICGFEECVTQNPLPHEVEDILIQEGNCMEDTVIRHICKICGFQVKSDTRYTEYDKHEWVMEMVDGAEMKVCIRCGIAVN